MEKTYLRLLGCAAAVLIGFSTPVFAEQTVKIGMVLSLSGPTASLGENILHGAELYLDTHKGELPKDVKIEILRRDDTGPNPDVAKRLAQELIVRDHVQMIAGLVFTPNAAAIAPLATQSKTPLVLMNGQSYTLSYRASGSNSAVLHIKVAHAVSPYTPDDYETNPDDKLTTSLQTFTHTFTPTMGNDDNTGVAFFVMAGQGICIANVSLVAN